MGKCWNEKMEPIDRIGVLKKGCLNNRAVAMKARRLIDERQQ